MRARRTDANHGQVKQAFEKLGCWVWDMSGVGGGFPDLLVVGNRRAILVEVKTAKGKTNALQEAFFKHCPLPCILARNLDDVVRIVGNL